ncbi:hypothetical protein NECHADRAFT_82011 [Paecilomyces variotii No. 5]|uniref:NADH:flavin oxidoreductase/NADH oxidase N-terminal domain-containing protein n=1 Tax=Byssochlamys spectabilis (strain No. 5 / NBRC 109023) TaxID=1356009 RepID=V5F6X1_BYSSN|nr:hypothetical protein NECHADRAFT_82011 [Paecilomyces variotii No. 5]
MAPNRWPSNPVDVAPLAQPLHFHPSGKIAKNRLLKTAMTEGLATWSAKNIEERGMPTKETIELYRRWGEGTNTYGMIETGNIDVEYDQLDAIGDMIITLKDPLSGRRFEAFQALAAAGKAGGALMIGQVSHPGAQLLAHIRKDAISASDVQLPPLKGPLGEFYAKARAALQSDIDHVVASFVHAAEYLAAAGFDGMQLHAAHGYLLAQFLSQRMNKRTDAYGGSIRNRMRIIVDICKGIRTSKAISRDFIVGIKLNSVEFQEGGLSPEEARELCGILAADEAGFDYIELSGGTWHSFGMSWERESTRRREAFFLEFADLIVPALGPPPRRTKVYITGGLRSAEAMVQALDVVDGVGLARPTAQEPRIASDILNGRVLSAIRPTKELENISMGLRLAATQIGQIGKGEEPFDASDESMARDFLPDQEKWYQAMLADGDKLEHHGYVHLSTPQRPYGEA